MTTLSTVDTPVLDRFLLQVDATPDAIAVVAGDTELTYRETLDRARALAANLAAGPDRPLSTVPMLPPDERETLMRWGRGPGL